MSAAVPLQEDGTLSFAAAVKNLASRKANIVDIPFDSHIKRPDPYSFSLLGPTQEYYMFYRLIAEDDSRILQERPEELDRRLHGIFIISNIYQRSFRETEEDPEVTVPARKDNAVWVTLTAKNKKSENAGVFQGTRKDRSDWGKICYQDRAGVSCSVDPEALASDILHGISGQVGSGLSVSMGDLFALDYLVDYYDDASKKIYVRVDNIERKTSPILDRVIDPKWGLFKFNDLFGPERRPRQTAPTNVVAFIP